MLCMVIRRILLDFTAGNDDFQLYKSPYLASRCIWVMPKEALQSLFSNCAQFDRFFDCIFKEDISPLYIRSYRMMCSRLGLFVAPMEQIVSTIPELLYDYLVKNAAKWVARFFSSFDRSSVVDIFRELLDLPSYSTCLSIV